MLVAIEDISTGPRRIA